MDCIIAAGGRTSPEDSLYPYTQGGPKALIRMNGKTMLEMVAAACAGSRYVDGLIVTGLDEAEVAGLELPSLLTVLPDQGRLIANVKAGLQWWLDQGRPGSELLLTTGDIPLVTPAIVDAFVEQCRPFDRLVYYNLVTKETLDAKFPGSRRTFVRLRDAEVAGGDMLLVQRAVTESDESLWEALTDARKHAWRLSLLAGPLTLLRLLTHRLTVAQIEKVASRVARAPVRVLLSPYAELAMDADKANQVELLRRYLAVSRSG